MSWHWDGNSNPTADLKDFLDPGNTGATIFDGAFNPCGFVSVEEIEFSDLSIYPNPSTGIFNIDLSNVSGQVERVEVYDALGSLLQSKEIVTIDNIEVDLSSFENGSYLISIWNASGQRVTRPIVLLK